MPAAVTLKEIGTLIDNYVAAEAKHSISTHVHDALFPIKRELERSTREGTASLTLKNYARVLAHFHEEGRNKRVSTRLFVIKAFDQLARGHDVPKAIKRGRAQALAGGLAKGELSQGTKLALQLRGCNTPILHADDFGYLQK